MTELDKEITNLKLKVAQHENEEGVGYLPNKVRKDLYLKAITPCHQILERLLDENNKVLLRDSNWPVDINLNNEKFNLFENGLGLALVAVAFAGLISLTAAGAAAGLYVAKHRQKATNKNFHSLLSRSECALSKINYSVLPRGQMFVGVNKEPIKSFDLHSAFKSIALVGDNRSGKTVFLSSSVLNVMFPWWYRCIFLPRGLFLIGSQHSPTAHAWLKNQIATTDKDDPWSALMYLVEQRRSEQWVRKFLHKLFKSSLPTFLKPQPVIIVVDQAEELLRAYRAECLVGFYNLVKKARDNDMLRLVLVINSENAVKSLRVMNGGNMFTVIHAPKVSREAVVAIYGESFAEVFDDCDSCIGVALDYEVDEVRPRDMTAKDFAAMKQQMHSEDNCLGTEITREEFNRARQHVKPCIAPAPL